MFAMFNLQLSSLDFSGELPETPVMTPETGFDFANLLQMSAPQQGFATRGEILPPAGSDLPLQPIPVDAELPPSIDPRSLQSSLPIVGGTAEQDVAGELAIDAELEYPLPAAALAASTDAPSTVPWTRKQEAVPGPFTRAEPALVAARSTPTPVTNTGQPAIAPSDPGLEAPLPVRREPVTVVTAAQTPNLDPEAAERFVPIDQPRRIDPTTSLNVAETAPEAPKARPIVNQVAQVLNMQPNPQQPQPAIVPSPAAAPDTGYAATMQQVGDTIPTAVRDPAWGDQIGERVVMMAGNQLKTAEIRLTPAELGPLRVQVSVEDGAANVTFQAQHAVTREAIEQALPRLREMLAENGLSLGQANVGEQGVAGRNRDEAPATLDAANDAEELPETTPDEGAPARRSSGLVDTFV